MLGRFRGAGTMRRSSDASAVRKLPPRWLTLARAVWVILVAAHTGLTLYGLAHVVSQPDLVLLEGELLYPWTPDGLSAALAPLRLAPDALIAWRLGLGMVALLVHWTVALVIFWRRSDEWLGLLASYVLAGIGLTYVSGSTAGMALLAQPWRAAVEFIGYSTWPAFFIFLHLYPDGRFVPRWTRILPLLWLVFFVAEEVLRNLGRLPDWLFFTIFMFLLATLASQAYRYARVWHRTERLQAKWLVYALVLLFVQLAVQNVLAPGWLVATPQPGLRLLLDMAVQTMTILVTVLIPIAIGIALFRYRLWDIDVIIRRTLTYTIVTALLALVFAGSIVLMHGLLAPAIGSDSPVATVISTLAIAALFNPLRRRVQVLIDCRFYRAKYDAQEIVAAFGGRLQSETDLEHLVAEIETLVARTLQPSQVGVSLTGSGGRAEHRRAASE
jgi:hypothetical protein